MNQEKFTSEQNLTDEKISLAGESLYPHLKITNEEFPRLLVTRKIANDGAEYFGAFLPATSVRLWLDFINRTFRLRTCQIPINGKFPSPCPQFYNKRCVAPCVESLCDRESYLESVGLVRLFLQNEREKLRRVLKEKIEKAAENLDFEKAASWRDALLDADQVFGQKDRQLWLGDTVDTFEVEEKKDQVFIYLVTQRGRKNLGRKVFVFENKIDKKELLSQIIRQFYRFHAPQEIRIPFDFPNRNLLAENLMKRERHPVKFAIFGDNNNRKTSLRALQRAKFDFDLGQIKPPVQTEDILLELKKQFNLSRLPYKIEAFDAAHISGKDFTAAKTVWKNGKFTISENEFWLLDETSELESLQFAVKARFEAKSNAFPDLLLIDGGKAQMQAALQAASFLGKRQFTIVCAVKPPGRHNEISHFITENGVRVEFSSSSESLRVLLQLRDDAHELANQVHRQRRDFAHFYELGKLLPSFNESERLQLFQKFGSLKMLSQANAEALEKILDERKIVNVLQDLKNNAENFNAAVKPVIVPIRYDDPNGDAKDLQPLSYAKSKK